MTEEPSDRDILKRLLNIVSDIIDKQEWLMNEFLQQSGRIIRLYEELCPDLVVEARASFKETKKQELKKTFKVITK